MKTRVTIALIGLMLLVACNNDDNKGSNPPATPNNHGISQLYSGTANATINSSVFNTSKNVTRFRSHGGLLIRCSDDQGRTLKFVIQNFLGNGNYTFGEGLSSNSQFADRVNGQDVYFINGTGTLSVTDYSNANSSFNAEFTMIYNAAIDASIVITAQGSLQNMAIVEIFEPGNGEMVLFAQDSEYYDDLNFLGRVSQTDILQILHDINPWMSSGLYLRMANAAAPSGVPYFMPPTGWGVIPSSNTLHWEYNEATQTASGHLKRTSQVDYEIWFSNIPIEDNRTLDLEIGEILFYDGSETVMFANGIYNQQFTPPELYEWSFQATNADGSSVSFQTSEISSWTNPPPYTGPGRSVQLFYFGGSNNPTYENFYGRFTVHNIDGFPNKKAVYFESNDRTVYLRAFGIE